MGLKRAFDEEGLQELSFKHPKQLDSNEQAASLPEINNSYGASQKTSFPEINPSYGAFQRIDIPGDAVGVFCDSLSKDDSSNAASKFEGTPVSDGTSGNREEDIGSQTVSDSCAYLESFEFTFPRRNLIQLEDAYSSLLNSYPTKEVPIGPDHQADVPVWDSTVAKKDSIDFINGNFNYTGGFIIGSCVTPMPKLELSDDFGKAIDSKLDCICLDGGSVRCVRQHVKEAREELKESIGLEKFVGLGFLEMGEEVSHKWTEEEEQLFHEVVYCNPVSHGRNFWVHLSTMFPSRSKKEIVSYYFNVFMLRRRAAQNRSSYLETDSDDDEWKGFGGPFRMTGDERSAAISFINQDVQVDHVDDSEHEYDDDDDDNSSDDSDDNGDGDEHDLDDTDDGDLQVGKVDATEYMERECHLRKGDNEYSDDHRFNNMPHHLTKSLGSFKELLDVEENTCMSFEIQPCVNGFHHPIYEREALQEIEVNGACEKIIDVNGDGPTDKFGYHYSNSLDSCDSKVWDITCPVGFMTSVDLLPTCNMMEEIFGPCNWSKSNNDKWLP